MKLTLLNEASASVIHACLHYSESWELISFSGKSNILIPIQIIGDIAASIELVNHMVFYFQQ
jgi:hypothetical protein